MTNESTRPAADPDSPIVSDRCLRKGAKFDFHVLQVRLSDGTIAEREVVRHPGAVTMVPILESAKSNPSVVMIRNHRLSLDRPILECPAGTLEPGEAPGPAATRETEEETGYRPATVVEVGRFNTSPGMTDELMYVFVAKGLTPTAQRLEADESIERVVMPIKDVWDAFRSGELHDGKSIAALMYAASAGHIPLEGLTG